MTETSSSAATLVVSSQIIALSDLDDPPTNPADVLTIAIDSADPHKWARTFSKPDYESKPKAGRKRTPMDIDFGPLAKTTGGLVKIILYARGKHIYFMPDWRAVTLGDSSLPALHHLRPEEIDHHTSYWNSVSFYCDLVKNGPNTLEIPYNLGMIIVDQKDKDIEFPIYYDPKVQNGG